MTPEERYEFAMWARELEEAQKVTVIECGGRDYARVGL